MAMSKTPRIRVAHDYDDFEEQQNVVLVIQDASVLDRQSDTVLENPVMAQNYKREFHQRIQEKLRGDADPDDPFFKGKILPKYDEHKPEKEGFYIDEETGEVAKDDLEVLELINRKLGINSNKGVFSLDVDKKVGSDFMTEEEYRGFTKKKKKKAIRDFSFLNQLDEEEHEELGKRNKPANGTNDHETERDNKLKLYRETTSAANEQIKNLKHFQDPKPLEEEEEFYALQTTIKNNKKQAEEKAKRVQENLESIFKKSTEQTDSDTTTTQTALPSKKETRKEDLADLKKVVEKAKAEFNDPFKRPEKYPNVIRKKQLTLAHQASGIASVIDVALPSERLREAAEKEPEMPPREADRTEEAEEESEEDNTCLELEGERDLGKSTFAALTLLRSKGMLTESNNLIKAGRNNDDKYKGRLEKKEDDDGLRLERRDKDGNLMTEKQAFRNMCWTFHNIKPSKIKQAKMSKKLKAQERVFSVHLG